MALELRSRLPRTLDVFFRSECGCRQLEWNAARRDREYLVPIEDHIDVRDYQLPYPSEWEGLHAPLGYYPRPSMMCPWVRSMCQYPARRLPLLGCPFSTGCESTVPAGGGVRVLYEYTNTSVFRMQVLY